ncbi:hypothetical protein L1887_07465 [Cichorium endivia]|nr:hypothetical protein L1887_07465 [Cichorium endivia]
MSRLGYLWDHVRRNEVKISEFVYDHNEDLEYRLMMDYVLESDQLRVFGAPAVDASMATYFIRLIRISAATPKKTTVFPQQYVAPKATVATIPVDSDLTNPIDIFAISCRTSSEEAIQRMHGSQIGQTVVHLSWGKSIAAKQVIYEALTG